MYSQKLSNVQISKVLKKGMRTKGRIKHDIVEEEDFQACLRRGPVIRIYETKT